MESRRLEIVLHSAKDLYDVKYFGTMDPYATFWITRGGVASEMHKTNVAKKAGSCPVWDYPMQFEVEPTKNDYVLFCVIQHDGKLFDRKIGEVQVPFKDLLTGDASRTNVSYPLMTRSGEVKGEIVLSHKFLEPVVISGKKDGSMRMCSDKVSGNSSGDKECAQPMKKVERKKKDGMMKKIAKNVGNKVVTEAVWFAGTVGAVLASEYIVSGNVSCYEDEDELVEDEDDNEDDDDYEDE